MQAPKTRGALSPAAQLLRSSRLFSLPNVLPRPQPPYGIFESSTATLPYPTRQAITTPPSSLARGDWGMKRPLPLRSTTKSSAPVLRVSSIDTIEHITDFEPAGDHVQTLKKWQELNMSISNEVEYGNFRNYQNSRPKSNAFESELDNTTTEPADGAHGTPTSAKRWKYTGPAIDTMSWDDFNQYLDTVVKNRRGDFDQFLKERIRETHIADKKRYCRERGIDPNSTAIEPTEEDYQKELGVLRTELGIGVEGSRLERMVMEFLDLSPTSELSRQRDVKETGSIADTNESARSTHPSAGLSYLRSHAFLENHPVLGPQANHTPVEARVLRPRIVAGRSGRSAILGVGGIASTEVGSHMRDVKKIEVDPTGLSRFYPHAEGGSKVWVEPRTAVITREGRIKLVAHHVGNSAAVDIKQGRLPKPEPPRRDRSFTGIRMRSQTGRLDGQTRPRNEGRRPGPQGYGLEALMDGIVKGMPRKA